MWFIVQSPEQMLELYISANHWYTETSRMFQLSLHFNVCVCFVRLRNKNNLVRVRKTLCFLSPPPTKKSQKVWLKTRSLVSWNIDCESSLLWPIFTFLAGQRTLVGVERKQARKYKEWKQGGDWGWRVGRHSYRRCCSCPVFNIYYVTEVT